MFYKYCFWVKHILENYIWIYVFLKALCCDLIIYDYIYENASYLVLHLGKCMNFLYEKMSIFYLIFDKKIIDFIVY